MADNQMQIQHMTNFILHEVFYTRVISEIFLTLRVRVLQAQEKADEVNAKAEQDYTMEKQRVVEDEKLKVSHHCDRRRSSAREL